MGRKSRAKGKAGELEVAALLRAHGFDGKRGAQFKGGIDSPDVAGLPGHHIEVKRVEDFRPYDALEQAERDAGGVCVPVVLHRRNGRKWLAVLDASHFLTMVKGLPIAVV